MKLIICLLFVFLSGQVTHAQNILSDSVKFQFVEKSKRQRTVGIVLLGAGAVTTIVGLVVSSNNFWTDLPGVVQQEKMPSGTGAFAAGLVMMAGSIPFFISARKNYKASLAVKSVPQLQLNTGLVNVRSSPQLSFTLTRQIF